MDFVLVVPVPIIVIVAFFLFLEYNFLLRFSQLTL